jgi:beta-1,4-mannosyl-glycoprotein beta-1,4-N-acetylglucosaminyltransferase
MTKKYKPKIYDCFPFFNELDLLEIRLSELYDHVDFFVLCESTVTHSGKAKPLYFNENRKRFKKWEDKIIHLIYDPKSLGFFFNFFEWLGQFGFMKRRSVGRIYSIFKLGRYVPEMNQRNYLINGLNGLKDEDIIFMSDLDEIWNPNIKNMAIRQLRDDKVVQLDQSLYFYFLNGRADSIWRSANVFRYKMLKKYSMDDLRHWTFREKFIGALFKVYSARKREIVWKNGGWHFSYLGGIDKIREKFENISHFENDSDDVKSMDNIKKMVKKGEFVSKNETIRLKYVKIDDSFPKTILKNRNKYKKLIMN